ncbi:UNVERIFIED_CONTAM: hypothetical protein K2H54_066006 [Gekko kuhli]
MENKGGRKALQHGCPIDPPFGLPAWLPEPQNKRQLTVGEGEEQANVVIPPDQGLAKACVTPALSSFLLHGSPRSSSSSHSLRYFYTALSEPGQGLPQFISVGYVDDQPISRYDSIMRKKVPRVPWMEKVVEYKAGYWETESQILQGNEMGFRGNLEIARQRYNQQNSTGLHTFQGMYGCEALETKRRWEGETHEAQRWKDYLEGTCVEWLRRYLGYGKETLQRTGNYRSPPMTAALISRWNLLSNGG